MAKRNIHDLVQRWEGNPILTLDDIPFKCLALHNAGAVKVRNEYILLLRVEDMRGRSFFAIARSENGFQFDVDPEPIMGPSAEGSFAIYEERGVEDARITPINGGFFITYTAHSASGSRLALARTDDFKSIERLGMITEPENRSGTLLPRMFDDKYALLERPLVGSMGNIWISYSKDLKYWGESKVVMTTRGGFWDCNRIGVGPPPIETDLGWLLIYYGTKFTSCGFIYRIGTALLDKDDPSKVIGRGDVPVLSPREYYERVGDVDNMVFSTGAILNEELGNLMIYYGAATNAICLGWAKMDMLLERCLEK